MKVHFKAEGSDIIPNKGFWFSLPVMIKVLTLVVKQGGGGNLNNCNWYQPLNKGHIGTSHFVEIVLFSV